MRRIKNTTFRDFWYGRTDRHTYNRVRNAYLRAIRKATQHHWNTVVQNTSPSCLWQTVRKALPKPLASLATINGATSFKDKAQVLRQAFFPDSDPPPQHQPSDSLEGFHPVTQEEVLKALEAIPPNSAPGDDTLPLSVWIRLHRIRPDILTHMTDWSLCSRMLPTILKRVLTMVIAKPGKLDYSVPKAYRMISLLPTLSKTIEHVALARMTVFPPNCLSPLQFACRKGYSSLDTVHLILEKVHKASNDKLYSSALFLDVQGAFDKVLH